MPRLIRNKTDVAQIFLEVKTDTRNRILDLLAEDQGIVLFNKWIGVDVVSEIINGMKVTMDNNKVAITSTDIPFVTDERAVSVFTDILKQAVKSVFMGQGVPSYTKDDLIKMGAV